LTTSTHSDLLFFSDKGKAYQIKMYDIPEGKRATRGKSIMNFLQLEAEERVTSILPMPKDEKQNNISLLMVTKAGVTKKVAAKNFHDVRRNGLIAIKLQDKDELITARFVDKGDTIILTSSKGQSIRFKESDVREMGRGAGGVTGMKLGKGDFVVGGNIIKKDYVNPDFFVMSGNGYGKKTSLKEYKIQKRGGSGIKTMKITDKTGNLITSKVLTEKQQEIVAISKNAQVIRVDVSEIPSLGRQTQGVRIMKMREGDKIASLTCL
jgi:DNA gyrase subunit A